MLCSWVSASFHYNLKAALWCMRIHGFPTNFAVTFNTCIVIYVCKLLYCLILYKGKSKENKARPSPMLFPLKYKDPECFAKKKKKIYLQEKSPLNICSSFIYPQTLANWKCFESWWILLNRREISRQYTHSQTSLQLPERANGKIHSQEESSGSSTVFQVCEV